MNQKDLIQLEGNDIPPIPDNKDLISDTKIEIAATLQSIEDFKEKDDFETAAKLQLRLSKFLDKNEKQ